MNMERGTAERWRHGKAEIRAVEMGSGKNVTEVIAERWPILLDKLRDKGLLTVKQHDAGVWLASLRHSAGLEPRQISSYNPLGDGGGDISDAQAERRSLYNRAVRVMGGDAVAVLAVLEGSYSPAKLNAVRDGLTALSEFI